MLSNQQKEYFDNLTPGSIIDLSKAKNPDAFKEAAFDYIDIYGHSIGFVRDYTAITKYFKNNLFPIMEILGNNY